MSEEVLTYKCNPIQQKIFDTLLYFDVFNYPLNKTEIHQFLSIEISSSELDQELKALVDSEQLVLLSNCYLLKHQSESIIENRIKANNFASNAIKKVDDIAKVAYKIPFVSGIFISGSLSKNYFDENSDYDFFIVTKANRLWICRTFFTVFYNLLPKSKKKLYCLNYFISESELKISDRNIFVATELATLIPIVNQKAYENLLWENSWHKTYLPNTKKNGLKYILNLEESTMKKIIEKVFFGSIGDSADSFLLRYTQKRWKRKFSDMSPEIFELQLRAKKHVCKRHTKGFQTKVITNWEEKLKRYATT